MKKHNQRKPLFERLQSALQQGIQFAQGAVNLRITVMPAPPPELSAAEILQLRRRLSFSQRVFARTLNVSTKTVQSWEQGNRSPSQAALRLLQLLDERPELVCQIIGATKQGDPVEKTLQKRE